MRCDTCKKTIRKNDNYFQVIEFKNKGIISNKYVHKNCQDEYDKYIRENVITPEQKEKMAEAIVKGLSMVKRIQEQGGISE